MSKQPKRFIIRTKKQQAFDEKVAARRAFLDQKKAEYMEDYYKRHPEARPISDGLSTAAIKEDEVEALLDDLSYYQAKAEAIKQRLSEVAA